MWVGGNLKDNEVVECPGYMFYINSDHASFKKKKKKKEVISVAFNYKRGCDKTPHN